MCMLVKCLNLKYNYQPDQDEMKSISITPQVPFCPFLSNMTLS